MGTTVAVKYNWRKEQNKSDCYQIDIRVTIDRLPRYYEVKVPQKVPRSDWSGQAPVWVKNTNPFAFIINKEILSKLELINALQAQLFLQKRKMTFYHIEKALGFKGDRNTFNDYFKNYVASPPELVSLEQSTWEKYNSFIGHLDKFNPRLRFDEIDVEMAARIRNYLANQPGLKSEKMGPASVKSLFDKFTAVLQHAADEDGMIEKRVVDAIVKKVYVVVPPRDEGLHWDVADIRNFKKLPEFSLLPSQQRDKKLFLLQIYGNWYYRDLIYMNRKDIHIDHEFGMYVMGGRNKNEQARIVPLWKFPNAETFMREFEDPDPTSTYWFKRDIFVDVQVYNRNLKTLADMAGIYREVSNKTARHTGMTLMARMGVSWPALKKIAGQKLRDVAGAYINMRLKDIIDATDLARFDKLDI